MSGLGGTIAPLKDGGARFKHGVVIVPQELAALDSIVVSWRRVRGLGGCRIFGSSVQLEPDGIA